MTIRMISSTGATGTIVAGAGQVLRAYPAPLGTLVDVPGDVGGDCAALSNQGFFSIGNSSGATRPNAGLRPGWIHIDLALNTVVYFDGSNWRSPITGALT